MIKLLRKNSYINGLNKIKCTHETKWKLEQNFLNGLKRNNQ